MSRTREMSGWIYLNERPVQLFERFPDNFSELKNVARAKLIIELPERKVELTESMLDEAWRLSATAETAAVHSSYLNLREKIFGSNK